MRRNTNETYKLEIRYENAGISPYIAIEINAVTYFGARHALESLSQLWGYDDGFGGITSARFIILDNVTIVDGPEFQHRGGLIDTSRNYINKVCLDMLA